MTDGTTTWSYVYDANGMRTQRSNGTKTYNYVYNGSQLMQMTVGNDTLYFTYGILGPTTVTWNGTTYYYALNAQGDVIGIYDEDGNLVVVYNWDNAWGYNPEPDGSLASTLGTLNPLRYRGYVYDTETGYYYLQSRYYDPEIGRFINADAFAATGQGFLGNNMFAYCGNNPVILYDSSGLFFSEIGRFLGEMCDRLYHGVKTFAQILVSPLKAITAELGGGIGIGAKAAVDINGIPVEIGAVASSGDSLVYEKGHFDIRNSTTFSAGIDVANCIGGSYTNGRSHSYFDQTCRCDFWEDTFYNKSLCPANQPQKSLDSTLSISGEFYFIIGAKFMIGIDLGKWNRELWRIYEESSNYRSRWGY